MTATVVSLFDGIGGFCRAFESVGARVVATVEIDKPAAAVSARHFPRAAQFSDVTEVSADDLRSAGFVSDRGIVTAGWPCQDFSVAGRRAGLDGARSGLWWQVVRILADLRPRWFLGENVPGLLSSVCAPECEGGCMETHGGAMGAVLGSLGQLGYGVAYRVLDAQHFGVPQRRNRVFIVGHLGEPWSAPAQVLLEPESSAGDSAASRPPGTRVAPIFEAGAKATGGIRTPGTTDEVVAALTSNGVGTCGSDDNQAPAGHIIAYTPDVAAPLTAGTAASPGVNPPGRRKEDDVNIVVQPLAVRGRDAIHAIHENQRGELTTSDTCGALKVGGGKPGQGYPAIAIDLRNAARETGTGAGTQGLGVAEGGPSYGVTSLERNIPGVAHETVVRRLTELECERLQGYPDGWTDGQSGAARYRQLGNSVAVPVVEWIARRLIAVDSEAAA